MNIKTLSLVRRWEKQLHITTWVVAEHRVYFGFSSQCVQKSTGIWLPQSQTMCGKQLSKQWVTWINFQNGLTVFFNIPEQNNTILNLHWKLQVSKQISNSYFLGINISTNFLLMTFSKGKWKRRITIILAKSSNIQARPQSVGFQSQCSVRKLLTSCLTASCPHTLLLSSLHKAPIIALPAWPLRCPVGTV